MHKLFESFMDQVYMHDYSWNTAILSVNLICNHTFDLSHFEYMRKLFHVYNNSALFFI